MRYIGTLLVVICLVLSSHFAKTQNMVNIDCPETLECIFDGIVIQEYLPYVDIIIPEVINCGNAAFTQMNYKFEATSQILSLKLTWDTPEDDNLKMGVISGCIPDGVCVGAATCSTDELMTLDIDDLIVGHEYIVYVDGCNVYEIDFELEITPGSAGEFDAISNIVTSQCEEVNNLCLGIPIDLTIMYQEENLADYFNQADATWHFVVDGPESFDVVKDNINEAQFNVSQPGDYIVCLTSVDLSCESYDLNFCTEFQVEDKTVDFGLYNVCEHDLNNGRWIPDSDWLGCPISEPGEMTIEHTNDCDCSFTQSVQVIKLEEVQEFVEIELCPDDYPFVYFDDYTFDYSQFDIEENLNIFRESLQRDYNDEKCDTLIHLVLINEEPDGRCSSCDLPVSLEKSKIVYCIPFDNEAVDVSGKRNIVNSVGVAFDDNGSSNNILWEAIFDGDGDFVSLPHMDDLNTSVFSFNLQFNKDDSFENGDIETLVSKGDKGKNNLRFEVNLEKVNETIFDLVSTFYTSTESVGIIMPSLQVFKWYDVAYVVETDSIALYLDGFLYEKVAVNANLRGNSEILYLGTLANNQSRTQYYNGRMNDFKYWKQKLSGQDVLFLHFPEREFEVEQSYFLSCCEQAEFRDIIIDINNPLDSVIVPNASPTGYDSVYILNYIQADSGPEINLSLAPQDISVQYQQTCQELCQTQLDWTTDLRSLFVDNCGDVNVTQSHPFQVVLDENISFIDVLITGTDICGQITTYTFGLELECLPSNVVDVPEQNAFELISNGDCINENEEYCIFSPIEVHLGFINQTNNTLESYPDASGFSAVLNINGVTETYTSADIMNDIVLDQLTSTGLYTICLESVSNVCETINSEYCQTIKIREMDVIDHGEVITCKEDIESSLPVDLSAQLRNLILSNPQETTISISEEDDCGCSETEIITLIINHESIEEISVEVCDGENYEGLTVSGVYTNSFVAANGCDSVRTVQLTVLPNAEDYVFAEICAGEFYQNYEESGIYTELFTATNGCDSTLVIELEVLPNSFTDILAEICPDSMFLGLNQTGFYEFMDTNIFGCDSITTLNLTVLEEMDPMCFVSRIENITKQVKIYPNPVSDLLTIDYDKAYTANIYNLNGLLVDQVKSNNNKIDVSKLANGIYFIKLQTDLEILTFQKFIKL